jgi:hypothetical protein
MIANSSLYSFLCGVNPEVFIDGGVQSWNQHAPVLENRLVFNAPNASKLPCISGIVTVTQCPENPESIAVTYESERRLSGLWINRRKYSFDFDSFEFDDASPGIVVFDAESEAPLVNPIPQEDMLDMKTLFHTAAAEKFHRLKARASIDIEAIFASQLVD